LCLERQLESGMFPAQVGRWNAREYWQKLPACRFQAPRDDAHCIWVPETDTQGAFATVNIPV